MPEPLRVLVGSLSPGLLPSASATTPPAGTLLLDLGPDHPSRAGLLELRLWTQDGVVTSARVVVGAMHRGAEKLFEVRDYRQILMLADRHDWQAPFAGELGVALACEQLLGLEVPRRATWLRTLLAEHTRVLSHLGFLAYVPFALGLPSVTAAVRELLHTRLSELTGNRIHPMANRLGGLAVDADDRWLDDELATMDTAAAVAARLQELLGSDPFTSRAAGVAVLDRAVIEAYGVSGPAARASGIPMDLRRSHPYLAYGDLMRLGDLSALPNPATPPIPATPSSSTAPGFSSGDALARLDRLTTEVLESVQLVHACARQLHQERGPVAVRLGQSVKLPEGEVYLATEAPLGMAGCHLVSRGEKTPWRLKLRTPSFSSVASLEALLPGVAVDELETTLASMGYVVGDIDR